MINRRNLGRLAGATALGASGAVFSSAKAQTPALPPTGEASAPGLRVPERFVPVPSYLSAAAQAHLARIKPPRPEGDYPAHDDTHAWRAYVERNTWTGTIPLFDGISSAESIDANGVPVFVIELQQPRERRRAVCFDIHGGAFVTGAGPLCKAYGMTAALARGMTVWAPDYRMPPDHPYPTPLDDCVAAYRGLLEQYHPQEIIVSGTSAGGNLAAALLMRLRDAGLPLPAGAILQSPELDLTESGDTFQTNMGLDQLPTLKEPSLLYAAGQDLAHPYLSPLLGDVSRFPPTIITIGTRELFLSSAVRMHRKLRDAGVYAELHVLDAAPHSHFGGRAPEDQALDRDINRFAKIALTSPGERGRALEFGV